MGAVRIQASGKTAKVGNLNVAKSQQKIERKKSGIRAEVESQKVAK